MLHFSRKDNPPYLLKNPDIITKNGDEIEDRAERALGKRLEPVENPRGHLLMRVSMGCSKHGTRLIFWMFHATR